MTLQECGSIEQEAHEPVQVAGEEDQTPLMPQCILDEPCSR